MTYRAVAFICGLLFALSLAAAMPAQACQTNALDLLKFGLANARSNFAAIRVRTEHHPRPAPFDPGTNYALNPATERSCPGLFTLEDNTREKSEFWTLNFSYDYRDATAQEEDASVVKSFSGVLKGYSLGPFEGSASYDGTLMRWDGPASTWVIVDVEHGMKRISVMVGHEASGSGT